MSWDEQKITFHLQRLKGSFVSHFTDSLSIGNFAINPEGSPWFLLCEHYFDLLGAIACLFGSGFFGWWAWEFFFKKFEENLDNL